MWTCTTSGRNVAIRALTSLAASTFHTALAPARQAGSPDGLAAGQGVLLHVVAGGVQDLSLVREHLHGAPEGGVVVVQLQDPHVAPPVSQWAVGGVVAEHGHAAEQVLGERRLQPGARVRRDHVLPQQRAPDPLAEPVGRVLLDERAHPFVADRPPEQGVRGREPGPARRC